MTKAQVIKLAQRDAIRTGKPLLVLNLNRFNQLYVIRDFDARLLTSDCLVAVVEADGSVA